MSKDEDIFADAMRTLGVPGPHSGQAEATPQPAPAEVDEIRRLAMGDSAPPARRPGAAPTVGTAAMAFEAVGRGEEDAEFIAAMERMSRPEDGDPQATPDDPFNDLAELDRAHVGTPKALRRRIKQGLIVHQAELDLHGLNREQARARVEGFLAESIRQRLSVVRVITGRGLRSEAWAVLMRALPEWLQGPLRSYTYSSVKAPGSHGGEGMRYIFLRRFAR